MASPLADGRLPRPAPDARLFWRVAGVLLAFLTGFGVLLVAVGQRTLLSPALAFDAPHNVLHAALAAGAVALGFGDVDARVARLAGRWLGGFLLLLGAAGLVSGDLFGLGAWVGLRLEAGECALYLALGAWGVYVGARGAD